MTLMWLSVIMMVIYIRDGYLYKIIHNDQVLHLPHPTGDANNVWLDTNCYLLKVDRGHNKLARNWPINSLSS